MNIYDSIHNLPIKTWLKIHETGELNLLIVEGTCNDEELLKAWQKIRQEHFLEFGLTSNMKRFLDLQTFLIYAYSDYGNEPTPINKTRMQIAEKDMEEFLKENEGAKFSDSLTVIEKAMGFPIDIEKTTVYDFYRRAKFVAEQTK